MTFAHTYTTSCHIYLFPSSWKFSAEVDNFILTWGSSILERLYLACVDIFLSILYLGCIIQGGLPIG